MSGSSSAINIFKGASAIIATKVILIKHNLPVADYYQIVN